MRTIRTVSALAAFLFAPAQIAATAIVPETVATVEGDSSIFLGSAGSSQRTQQAYASSLFVPFASSGIEISEVRFRVDGGGHSFASTPDLEVRFSTTTQNPEQLSLNFAANTGVDEVIALPRSQLSWNANTVPGGPNSFDVVIPLPNHFQYYPANGNLLIDIKMYSIGFSVPPFDAQRQFSDGMSIVGGSVSGPTAIDRDPAGLVTSFSFSAIPEPTVLKLFTAAIFSFFIFRRRHVAS